jgi:C4-dicarboxylate transporter, DctM subunit
MSDLTFGVIGLVVLVILMFFSIPVALVFGIVGFAGISILWGVNPALTMISTIPASVTTNYTWTTMPMFVMMGYFAFKSGIIDECYEGFRLWIGRIPGGLAHTVILGNAAFGAVSGSGMAAALTFCAVSLPEMRKNKYKDALSIGSIGAGTLLAGLIPPSMPFIVFGGLTNVSIGKLFIAGIVPGICLMVLYLITVAIWCKIDPKAGPAATTVNASWKERFRAPPGMWMILLVFVVLIGGLYMGIFTPTEGGAVAAFLLLAAGLARRKLKWEGIKFAAIQTGMTTGMFFLILICVMIFNQFIVITGLNDALTSFVTEVTVSPTLFLIVISVMYLVLGTFLDSAAIVLITVPMIYPVSNALGVDPLALGVIVTLTSTLGSLTPPYGMTLFAMKGVLKDVPFSTVVRGMVPFYAPVVVMTLLLIFIPALSNWLPGMMK